MSDTIRLCEKTGKFFEQHTVSVNLSTELVPCSVEVLAGVPLKSISIRYKWNLESGLKTSCILHKVL